MGAKRKIVVNGVEYASVADAARAFNVSVTAMYNAINKGMTDNYSPRQFKRKSKGKEKVVVDGVEYESMRQAEIALYGRYTGRFSARKSNGSDMSKSELKGNRIETISANGTVYDSRAAFAKAAGIDSSSVTTRVQRGSFMAENPLSNGGKRRVVRIEVEVDGVKYPTLKEAKKWLHHGHAWFSVHAKRFPIYVKEISTNIEDLRKQEYILYHQSNCWDEDRIIEECDRRMKKLFAHGKLVKKDNNKIPKSGEDGE